MAVASQRRDIHIAYVDDHTMLRESIAKVLVDTAGLRVIIQAANGKEFLDILEASLLKPDVCLLDVSMPVMNGYDTLVELKHKWPEIKVLVVTMIDHHGNFQRMLDAGADGYILKDAEIEQLVYAIHSVHEHGFYHNPQMEKILPFTTRRKRSQGLIFTKKEEEFLRLCATELSYKQIAAAMNVSVKSVEGYRGGLFERLGVKSRTGLALYALQTGIALLKPDRRT